MALSIALAVAGIGAVLVHDPETGSELRVASGNRTASGSNAGDAPTGPAGGPGPDTGSAANPPAAPLPPLAGDTPVTEPGGPAPIATPDFSQPSPIAGPRTSTPPTPVALCSPAQVEQTITTDKPAYGPDESVNVTATVVNRSGRVCAVVDPGSECYSLLAAYIASDDRPVWRSRPLLTVPCRVFPRLPLLPGMGAEVTGSWDQSDGRNCSPYEITGPCLEPRVPGNYTVRSSWLAQPVSTAIDLV